MLEVVVKFMLFWYEGKWIGMFFKGGGCFFVCLELCLGFLWGLLFIDFVLIGNLCLLNKGNLFGVLVFVLFCGIVVDFDV